MADRKSHQRPLTEEAYRRVNAALEAGQPRKRAYSNVAHELNALGYRSRRNLPLRATSIEKLYYEARHTHANDSRKRH